ncbi:MAG: hypothetical protein JHC57_01570 [Sphingopyxis sp.]|uniref:acyl-CoA dehydrogenase family protein n=1 Tax=Sphingopyxis sp. TaxID=1908224 RepID=UPI001A32D409|nr:acyl-CoA dehydrogenase family protein [Sphingopyxis sp.]MBJ7498422.1 hypothetical protein [Sphingopyxis sp.]
MRPVLEPGADEEGIADALRALCRTSLGDRVDASDDFPFSFWQDLAGFGFFALAAEDGFGGAVDLYAAAQVLGAFGAPGPLADAIFAAQLALPERDALLAGSEIAVLCRPPHIPWGRAATILLVDEGVAVRRVRLTGDAAERRTLAGDIWLQGRLETAGMVPGRDRAAHLRDIFLSGYLRGALGRLVEEASAYVASRRQFGKALSQFQGVSFPLAEAGVLLRAMTALGRQAAFSADHGPAPHARVVAARLSAAKAVSRIVPAVHQVYGAIGVTRDGPVFHLSRRLRQLVNLYDAGAPGVPSNADQEAGGA